MTRLLALALTFIALAPPTAALAADPPAVIRVGVLNSVSEAPLYIGDKLGYFRDEGLTLQFVRFTSASTMTVPLATGQLDVGGGAAGASYYNALARGIDVRAVADSTSDAPGFGCIPLMVRTELVHGGAFRSLKDLKGRTVALNVKGGVVMPLLARFLERGGLRLADVKISYISFSDQVVAFKNGSIDAAVMVEPNATVAEKDGYAVRFLGDDAVYPNQQIAAIFYGKSLLRGRRELGIRFMRAYIRSLRTLDGALSRGKLSGPAAGQIVELLSATVPDPAILRDATLCAVSRDGALHVDSMRRDFAFFKEQGLVGAAALPAHFVDTSFVTEALASLRERPPAKR